MNYTKIQTLADVRNWLKCDVEWSDSASEDCMLASVAVIDKEIAGASSALKVACIRCGKPGDAHGEHDAPGVRTCGSCYEEWLDKTEAKVGFRDWMAKR